jgi:hypothetical protein
MSIVPASFTRKLARQMLVVKKNSPHIFFGLGVVGTVASTVLACRATLKLDKELDEIKGNLEDLKELRENVGEVDQVTHEGKVYTPEQYNNDAIYVYTKSAMTVTKLYAPAVIIGAASIACLTGSHVQMTRRNSALMAAYAAVQNAYENYRNRVREQLGVDRELDLYHGAKNEVMVNELGDEVKVKVVKPGEWSPYARFFDENSKNFQKHNEYNQMFLNAQEKWANKKLVFQGHLFLNEVYDMLGFERTKEGSVIGWLYNGEHDNYVKFGHFAAHNERFVNGLERVALLDFNVDGIIYDKI